MMFFYKLSTGEEIESSHPVPLLGDGVVFEFGSTVYTVGHERSSQYKGNPDVELGGGHWLFEISDNYSLILSRGGSYLIQYTDKGLDRLYTQLHRFYSTRSVAIETHVSLMESDFKDKMDKLFELMRGTSQ